MLSTYALQTMIDTMPIAACVFSGTDHVVSAANAHMLAIWNKDAAIIGKELFSAMPEIQEQGFFELLTEVFCSGQEYRNPNGKAMILVEGELQPAYFDFSLKPLRDMNGLIYGVVNTAVDTSEKVVAADQLEKTIEELAASNEELVALNEEYLALNEELEAGSEELRAANEELYNIKVKLEQSMANLAASEERLLLAAEAVNLGMYDIDLIEQRIVTSEKFDQIFGFADGVSLKSYQDAIHREDMELREIALMEAMRTGRLFYEVRVIKKDQSVIWVRAEGKVIYNQNGEPERILGTLLDFTAERQSKEVQRKLKTLADNSADLMSLLDLDGRNSYINDAGKTLLGFGADQDVSEVPISDLHESEDFLQVQNEVLPAVMNNGSWLGWIRVRNLQSREVFPVLNYAIRIDDPNTGKPIGVGAIMRDLRPEIASKKALADSESMLRNVTSASPTALWLADKDGNLSYVNQRWIDWTGLSETENLGMGWLNSVFEEDRDRVRDTYFRALSSRQSFEMEYRIINFQNQIRWFYANGQPQFDSEKEFNGFVGACSDITSHKEIQQHKDDFISIASHELKTPITSLKASIQLLNKIKIQSENPLVPKLLMQAGKSVERVGTLIDDLLNVSRFQQQELALNKTNFNLLELLKACSNPISIAGKQQIQIRGNGDFILNADEHRIDQVLTNLLSNAVKYAPESECIEINVQQRAEFVEISVKDYGPGIPSDRLKHLFERYYRAEDSSSNVSGLGLGLYISSEIIHRHNGKMGVESELGKGSTFWFTLPLNDVASIEANDGAIA